jgi:type VI secretion system protein ImpJ
MRSPQRLVWSEGMLLSPQHLQALDRFHEAFVAARLGALSPLDWGVLELDVDPAALAAGQVRLVRFAGVLPEGTPVAFDEASAGPAPREVAGRFPATARSLDVHLAVPRERDGIPSYGEEGTASPSRFLAGTRPVQDATSPGASVPVRFARPNAVLLLGDEARDDHESLKIAEIVRSSGGQLALAGDYLPPCLRVGAAPGLLSALREVLTLAIAKQRELAEARRSRESASEVTAPDLVRFLQLLVLDGNIPALAHLAEAGEAPPRECFLALSGLAGQLCAFRGEDPSALPRFQHLDLRATFEPLLARLRGLLGGLAVQEYVTVPIEKRPGGLFLARFPDERVLQGQLFLVVKSNHPESMVVEQLPRLCKVAAASEIQGLVQAAAPGLPLQVAHRPPPQLPVRPGSVYFSLVPDGRYWQGIVSGRNLAMYLPPPFDPAHTDMELLAIPGQTAPPPMTRRG